MTSLWQLKRFEARIPLFKSFDCPLALAAAGMNQRFTRYPPVINHNLGWCNYSLDTFDKWSTFGWVFSASVHYNDWIRSREPWRPIISLQYPTSNGSWCIGIKGEMSGTVCVTFTWDIYIYIYIWVVYSFCLFCCLFIIVTWWYIWCIVWQVASKRKYRHVW